MAHEFEHLWKAQPPQPPIPPGEYEAVGTGWWATESKKRTPGRTLRVVITEGEYAGRPLYRTYWLTEASAWKTLPELNLIGIDRAEDLDRPRIDFPMRVTVASRRGGDGKEYTEVTRVERIGPAEQTPPVAQQKGGGDLPF